MNAINALIDGGSTFFIVTAYFLMSLIMTEKEFTINHTFY